MNRINKARQMIAILESTVNCDNVVQIATKDAANDTTATINDTDVSLAVIHHPATDKLYQTYDLMVRANYSGHEIFPYLYGVLDCRQSTKNIYVYYEKFDYSLPQIMDQLTVKADWFDIVYQLISIDYYIKQTIQSNYQSGDLYHHWVRILDKPYLKKYTYQNIQISVYHKYLIVLWDIQFTTKKQTSNLEYLLSYLKSNPQLDVPTKIYKLLKTLIANPNKTIEILIEYYQKK